MTCRFALSLLADFIDNELLAADAEQLRNHLNTCPDCRAEYENSVRLKEFLGQMPAADPGARYWEDVTPIILAKTTENVQTELTRSAVSAASPELRQSFTRALITCVISLTLLFSAVMIGRQYRPIRSENSGARAPILVAASMHSYLGSDRKAIMTVVEEQNINLGALLVGAPSSLGRFAGLYSFPVTHPLRGR